MPKRPLKKTPKRKPTTPKARKKPTPKKVAAKPHGSKRGFMWKLLEHKQAELKRLAHGVKHPYAHADDQPKTYEQKGHSRFAGPRRRAA